MRHLRKEIDITLKAITVILGVLLISINDYDTSLIGYYLFGVIIWLGVFATLMKWGRDI